MNRLRRFEPLEDRIALSATPFGAQPNDTAEFMLGTVSVTVVLLESNDIFHNIKNSTVGTPQEENWTAQSIAVVKQKVTEGLQWWVDTLADITDKHELHFNIDFTHTDTPVSTSYEPITRPSTDYQFWIYDFLDSQVSDKTNTFTTDVRTFNHQQRQADDTNWAFTIFVVNDEHDADHRFNTSGGGFERAFAFPGGLFLVTLASRPASTITHEMGHIFWALDEYETNPALPEYMKTRGYYGTPNTNAADNPIFSSQTREPSIMDRGSCEEGGGLLCDAYQQHTSSQSSLEMIGWRDSDGNGIFDVLDVPHTLEGTGFYDPVTGLYRFVGESSVQTLPNLNPRIFFKPTESLQNDITINRISRAEYRIDGGAWQTAAAPDTYVATLDLSFAVPAAASQIEIRTVDAVTGVTSPVFTADLMRPASTMQSGISGFVFGDADSDGQFETGESGLAGQIVRLVDASGQAISLEKGIEPDDYPPNTVIGNVIPEATLTAIGTATAGGTVYARSVGQGSTGSLAFGACSFLGGGGACSIPQSEWTSSTRQLRIDFASPVTTVSMDAVSNNDGDYGRLAVYDANDNLLARYTTNSLASGQVETMTLARETADIAYAIAGGHADTAVRLDNLRFGPQASAVTDQFGAYSIPSLAAGSYRVQVEGIAGSTATTPMTQTVTISADSPTSIADFGFVAFASSWQNPTNRFDVNNDGVVSPIDALQIINDLNLRGARLLTAADAAPPYFDVNGDGHVAPIDVLQVINSIETSRAEGEFMRLVGSESQPTGMAEGEFMRLVGSESQPTGTVEGEFTRLVGSESQPTGTAEGEFIPATRGLHLTRRALQSHAAAPQEAVRGPLPLDPAELLFARAAPARPSRDLDLAILDDLRDTSPLEAAIADLADDVAAIWGSRPTPA